MFGKGNTIFKLGLSPGHSSLSALTSCPMTQNATSMQMTPNLSSDLHTSVSSCLQDIPLLFVKGISNWHVPKDSRPSFPKLFFSHSSFLVDVYFNLSFTQAKNLGLIYHFLLSLTFHIQSSLTSCQQYCHNMFGI